MRARLHLWHKFYVNSLCTTISLHLQGFVWFGCMIKSWSVSIFTISFLFLQQMNVLLRLDEILLVYTTSSVLLVLYKHQYKEKEVKARKLSLACYLICYIVCIKSVRLILTGNTKSVNAFDWDCDMIYFLLGFLRIRIFIGYKLDMEMRRDRFGID